MKIVFKTLNPEEVLTTLIYAVAEVLPQDIKDNDNARLSATFNDDNSVDIYLIIDEKDAVSN
jgi:hypothetical protein